MTAFTPERRLSRRDAPASNRALNLGRRGAATFRSDGVREMLIPRRFAPGAPETRTFPLHFWERLERRVLKEAGWRMAIRRGPSRRAVASPPL